MAMNLKRQRLRHWLLLFLMLAVMIAGILAAGVGLYRYARSRVYDESIAQLQELSTQLFEKLDVQIDLQWSYLDKLESLRTGIDTMTADELTEFLAQGEKLLGPADATILFRAIDSDGYYYTNEGRQGFWTGLDQLDSSSDRQSFLIANWPSSDNYMAFSFQIKTPLTVNGRQITHFVLLRTMTDMGPFFHSTAFANSNIVYIINSEGLVTYEDGSLSGVDFVGRNIFASLKDQIFPHAGSIDAVIAEANTETRACTDVTINGKSFFLIYERLPQYNWGAVLLVSADSVATSTSQMVNSIIRIFAIAAGIIILTLIAMVWFVLRLQSNRRTLRLQVEANHKIEKTNELLQRTNQALEQSRDETNRALATATSATRAKSQFLANMSHDIRTPMNAIMGITKLMEGDLDNRERLPYYIKKLEHSGNYMLGLINDILDMSKIESGEVHINLESVKIAEQVGQIESIIRSQSNEHGQKFTVFVHELSHEYLIGDSIRIRQILLNLLNNAVKYTPYGGSICLEITELPCDVPDHATIRTSVTDNGYGMEPEFLTRIFEPFTRAENSVTNKIQGTGLGMSITKSLVDLMGGTITVQSEPGKGSRFDVTLTLPVDTGAIHSVSLQSILLITEDELLASNVRAALRSEPVTLRVAATIDQALSLLNGSPADAILLNGYPDTDTLRKAAEQLRQAAKDAILVFCCDYTYRDNIREMLTDSGVDGLIARPFFFENLVLAVQHARSDRESTASRQSGLQGKRFLCAEDNDLNAEILEALLQMHGASCTIFPSGVEIVQAFENVRPGEYDAILMDVQMPGMNGMDATRSIRAGKNPLGKTIPIIAMTANAFSSDVQDCLDSGMNAHLAKPLDITALERTLHEIQSAEFSGGEDSCPPPKDT